MRLMLALLASISFLNVSTGQDTKVSEGDTVKYQIGGKWQDAKVVEINGNGWLRLTLDVNGRPFNPLVPPKRVLSSSGKPVVTDVTTSSKGKDQFPDEKYRRWRDNRNKLIAEAKIHRFLGRAEKGKVLIHQRDGRCISKWVKDLSTKDKEYVLGLVAE